MLSGVALALALEEVAMRTRMRHAFRNVVDTLYQAEIERQLFERHTGTTKSSQQNRDPLSTGRR
jgi:hypothetical protein